MAYMRGSPYVYESGVGIQVHSEGGHRLLDADDFDALALMRIAELLDDPERFKKVAENALSYAGNFGVDALSKILGMPGGMDYVRSLIRQHGGDRRDDFEVCETCGTFLRAKAK